MSTTSKTKLNDKAINQLTNDLEKLKCEAQCWFKNEYKTSNEKLYDMFASLYTLYEKCVGNDEDVQTNVRAYVTKYCAKKNIKFKAKKPTLQALLVKFMFDDGVTSDCKRINSYVRVFTLATTLSDVNSKNMAKWIEENGGIENLRQQQSTNGVTKEQRIEIGKQLIDAAYELGTISTETTKGSTIKADEIVVLVGVQKADGSVSIKHTIYEKALKSNISGKTAINTALFNVYSTYNEALKNQSANKSAEKEAQQSTDISDIMNAEDKSFQNEMKEAA